MKRPRLHDFVAMPVGKRVQDLLPAFADVVRELPPIGTPSPVCPGCRKPFNSQRKRRSELRLYPAASLVPVVIRYDLCGKCGHTYRQGGDGREGLLASVQAFMDGEEATQ